MRGNKKKLMTNAWMIRMISSGMSSPLSADYSHKTETHIVELDQFMSKALTSSVYRSIRLWRQEIPNRSSQIAFKLDIVENIVKLKENNQ